MAGQTRRAREMARLVARWERSGLTQAAFARQIGRPAATFAWWRQRLRQAASAPPALPAAAFTEVVLAAPAPAAAEVVLRNGRLVRVPLGADPGAVGVLVEALDAPC